MSITFKRSLNGGILLLVTFAAVAFSGGLFAHDDDYAPGAAVPASFPGAAPAPAAATTCPPRDFASNTNLARNPSFELVGPNGASTSWHAGDPIPSQSAAKFWLMHTDNAGATVASKLQSTTAPGPGGARMLHFLAGGNEGGIIQQLHSPAKLMFSAWVFVRRGQVVLQPNSGTQGPSAWSTKRNQWEQLRVCTDGSVPTGFFTIYNQDPAGGDFFVDRVEIRETP